MPLRHAIYLPAITKVQTVYDYNEYVTILLQGERWGPLPASNEAMCALKREWWHEGGQNLKLIPNFSFIPLRKDVPIIIIEQNVSLHFPVFCCGANSLTIIGSLKYILDEGFIKFISGMCFDLKPYADTHCSERSCIAVETETPVEKLEEDFKAQWNPEKGHYSWKFVEFYDGTAEEESHSVFQESVDKESEDGKRPLIVAAENEEVSRFYSDIMPLLVKNEPGIGEDSFILFGSLFPLIADFVNATSAATGAEFADDEFILCVDGTALTQRLVRHIGGTSWPGRLTLTNYALYFEASGKLTYEDALKIDLAKNAEHSVKTAVTGPWGALLFDKDAGVSRANKARFLAYTRKGDSFTEPALGGKRNAKNSATCSYEVLDFCLLADSIKKVYTKHSLSASSISRNINMPYSIVMSEEVKVTDMSDEGKVVTAKDEVLEDIVNQAKEEAKEAEMLKPLPIH
ncbi:hypothetical protein ACFE04_016082 [Oxalis oulophora]